MKRTCLALLVFVLIVFASAVAILEAVGPHICWACSMPRTCYQYHFAPGTDGGDEDCCRAYMIEAKDWLRENNHPMGWKNLKQTQIDAYAVGYEWGSRVWTNRDYNCDGKKDGWVCAGGIPTFTLPIGKIRAYDPNGEDPQFCGLGMNGP